MTASVIPCDDCPEAVNIDGRWRCECKQRVGGRCNCEEARNMAARMGIERTTWAPCIVPGHEYSEYCREYCNRYGTGTCVYDPDTGRMMVKTGGD